MADVLSYLAAAVVALAALIKYLSIRPARPTSAQRHQLIMLAAFVPAHVLSMPRTQAATAAIDPVPYATAFASHALAMIAGNSLLIMLAHVLGDPISAFARSRRRAATGFLVVAVLAMAALLVTSEAQFNGEFLVVAAHHPTLVAYYLVFVAFMGFCVGRLIVLLRRYLSRPVELLMRWGMRGVVVGAGVGLLYLAWTVFAMIDSNVDRLVTNHAWLVAEILGAVCVLFMAAGSTLSVFAAQLTSRLRQWRVRRALHGLTPMWRMLVETLPDVTFHQADLLEPEDVLYRQVIEIRDVQLRLTEHIPPDVEAAVLAAAGGNDSSDRRHAVRAEAAVLAVAIDAYHAECPCNESAVISDPGGGTLDTLVEARRLIDVYLMMCHDPKVARIAQAARARLRPPHPDPDLVARASQ